MGESLTMRRRVRDEGLRIVNLFRWGRIQTVLREEATANSVPAPLITGAGRRGDTVVIQRKKISLYAGKLTNRLRSVKTGLFVGNQQATCESRESSETTRETPRKWMMI